MSGQTVSKIGFRDGRSPQKSGWVGMVSLELFWGHEIPLSLLWGWSTILWGWSTISLGWLDHPIICFMDGGSLSEVREDKKVL